MVDHLLHSNDGSPDLNITLLIVLIGGIIILSTILGYYTNILMQQLGFQLRNNIRTAYFKTLLNFPVSFFKDEAVGKLTSRATEDISMLQNVYSGILVPAYQNILFITGCLILMLMLNPFATGIVTLIILCIIPLMYYFSRKIKVSSGESQKEHALANAVMDESLTGIREVKALLLEERRIEKYKNKLIAALVNEVKSSSYQAKSTQSVFVIVSLLLLFIFYIGIYGSSSWSPGSAVAFYFYSYSLTMAFLSLGRVYSRYYHISGSTIKITETIDLNNLTDLNEVDNFYKPNINTLKGKVEFKNVSFGYNSKKLVLNNISFSVNPGEWLLITGPSGSGKSTISSLILGFYKANNGEILIDDKNIKNVDTFTLRNNIGFVGQEAILFEGTIRENILIKNNEISEKKFYDILKISMAEKFINQLPNGADTNIAERGITLSAGQRSRIAIARALVNEPAILVLDEANSMLEGNLEAELWHNLLNQRNDKTTIIFSHHTEFIPKVYKHIQI